MRFQHLSEARSSVTIRAKKPEGFVEYMRSIRDLKNALQEHTGSSKVTILSLGQLFAQHNIAAADNLGQFSFNVKELLRYTEFDRRPNRSQASAEQDYWDSLKDSIKKHGVKDYGVVTFKRHSNGSVEIYVSEGNHRVAIADEVGIKAMNMNLYYYK